jgi:hypothetical protein
VRRVRRAQDQFVAIEQVNQAGIALGELHDQRHDPLQYLLQVQLTHHQAADLLKQA